MHFWDGRLRGALFMIGITVTAALGGYWFADWLGNDGESPIAATERHPPPHPAVVMGDGTRGPRDMAWVPGGEFLMGSDHQLAQPNERPTHRVRVHGFWMDRTHVTNAQFREFTAATGYRTTAERKPDWETLRVQLPPGTQRPADEALVPGALVFVGTEQPVDLRDVSQWWAFVPGANWKAPRGPGSDIDGRDNHPVVQVSYEDVLAYAEWVGKRLPTEAEWEFAARGGLEQATYTWGEEYQPGGDPMANVWDPSRQGRFPVVSPKAGGAVGTLRVGTFPPNGYGLVDMTGNAWQWTADWYRSDYFQIQKVSQGETVIADPRGPHDSWDPEDQLAIPSAPRRVIRGGSFLCNSAYCLSYRPSARRGNDPYNAMNHIGFRLVSDGAAPGKRLSASNSPVSSE
jgi:formylglycine-generating enzyme required for sulfatase activity